MRLIYSLGSAVLLGAACDISLGGSGSGDGSGAGGGTPSDVSDTVTDPAPRTWTGRFYEGEGLAWASHRNLTSQEFGELFQEYLDKGWIIVDVDARPEGSGALYSMVWHENPDGRRWAEHRDLTSEEYGDLWETYAALDWRPLDVEAYTVGGQTRYAGIWIENIEGILWSSWRDETSDGYNAYFNEMLDSGYIPIDVEGYESGGQLLFAGIFVENVEGRAVAQYRNLDRSGYQEKVDDLAADGYQMVDYESYTYGGTQYYAAIWERPLGARATVVATDREHVDYTNTWRELADAGYRMADQEAYDSRYGGIWLGNDDRRTYAHKPALDEVVQDYRDDAFPDERVGAISVAAYHHGELVYVRGVGEADADEGLIAHGSTVYRLASVSKAVGGTLAAMLEANTQLRDGTPYSLDLGLPTADYLPDLPEHHTHTAEQLAAHLGCVMHYPTANLAGITNQSIHYETAQDAVESIWDDSLTQLWDGELKLSYACEIGDDWFYSTPAFTFLGAVLESATERPVSRLLDEEIFIPHGLASMRVQWAGGTLPENPLRAVGYLNTERVYTEADNTWKVLGGGIESNVVDLARFGQLALDGALVPADVRDDRMWSPVDPRCILQGGLDTCRNGLGWELGVDDEDRSIAEHGGSWSGARSHLRVYRDDELVIAVMSNRTSYLALNIDLELTEYKHYPPYLVEDMAAIILD